MKILHLHVKYEYFDQMKRGEKLFEYREVKDYWTKQLSKDYDEVWIWRAYQKESPETVIKCRWVKPKIDLIVHKHWGNRPVLVYAIPVNEIIVDVHSKWKGASADSVVIDDSLNCDDRGRK